MTETQRWLLIGTLALFAYWAWKRAKAARAAAQAHAAKMGQVTAIGNVGTSVLAYFV